MSDSDWKSSESEWTNSPSLSSSASAAAEIRINYPFVSLALRDKPSAINPL